MPNANATVLVVEDEALVRDFIVEELRDAGFNVLEAADGESALKILSGDAQIDVLFTDIRLPGRHDGWAVARLARERRPAMPVIYASGYTIDRNGEVPGSVFVNKPYQPSQIVATIRTFLA